MDHGEWTLRSLRVVTPSGVRAADLAIRGGRIAAVRAHDDAETEGVVLDVGDAAVLPGLVDLRADFNAGPDPRGLEIRTRLAAAGGVTTLIDPPVDFGPEPGVAAFSGRLASLAASLWVDCGFYAPLLPLAAGRVDALADIGLLGFKARFGGDDAGALPAAAEADLRAAMPTLARAGRLLVVAPGEGAAPVRLLIDLCRRHRAAIHLARAPSADDLGPIAEARAEGLPFTTGALASDFLPGDGDHAARDPIWSGLRAGLIDAIAPDGPPWGDATGRPPLAGIWAEAARRGFAPADVARWMAARPAGILGLGDRKGSIAEGHDADLVVFDPDDHAVEVEITVVRGAIVQASGRFEGRPRGDVLLRLEETWPASSGLDRLNALDDASAVAALGRCGGSARWAREMAALRPFGSRAALIEAADRVWSGLGRDDRIEAIAAHRARLDDPADSCEARAELARIAGAYGRIFDFPLAFRRDGPIAEADLDALRRRLTNPPDREFALAAEEVAHAARRALGRLLA